MSYKSRDGKVHTSTILIGENGLPVDTIATISGSYIFLVGDQPLTYIAGAAEVTLPVGFDLTPVTLAKPRYTGKYILLTASQDIYYIDRQSIDPVGRTFTISTSDKAQVTPASIDLSAGWKVAEADIINRVATTAAAKIDNIEFRDLQFQMELDGDPVTIRGEKSGYILEPNPDGSIGVVLGGIVDEGNSSSQTLITNAEFLGSAIDTLDYALVFITVFSDVASAIDGLHIKVSSDNVTWRDSDSYTIAANTEKTFSFQPVKKYMKIHYINGGTTQGVMDLQVILKKVNSKPSSHRISDTISQEDDATLQKSVLTAQQPDGDFNNIGATASGNLKVSDAENGLAIAKGEVLGTTAIAKFGENPDISSATVPEDVWDYGGVYTFSTTNDIDSISSSDNADIHTITIEGLDINWEVVVQTITLTGQTRKALDTPLIRVYRAYNSSATSTVGDIYIYVNTALVAGVPTAAVDVRAMIRFDNEQTMMSIYTVPAGKTGYYMGGYVSMSTTKSANAVFTLRARTFGGVLRIQDKVSVSSAGNNSFIRTPFVPGRYTEKSDILIRCDQVSVNGVGVSGGFDFILVDDTI